MEKGTSNIMNISYFKKQMSDKLSICLSICCILHCIALPVLILIIPSISSFWINDENVHVILVLFAVPISLYAMGKSLRIHHNYKCISFRAHHHLRNFGLQKIQCMPHSLF